MCSFNSQDHHLNEVLLSVGLVLVEVVDFEGHPNTSTVNNSIQPSKFSLQQYIPACSSTFLAYCNKFQHIPVNNPIKFQ